MAELRKHALEPAAPGAGGFGSDAVGRWLDRRRRICDSLESLVDDLYGRRSRQAASLVLDFMATDRFGAPDDHVGELIAGLPAGPALHPVLAPLSDWLEEDQEAARRRERLVVEGLEAIVFGRMPENALDFIIAALALVEVERSYHDVIAGALAAVAATEPPPCEPFERTGANPREAVR